MKLRMVSMSCVNLVSRLTRRLCIEFEFGCFVDEQN